ncbi:MAG TPA: SusD/RagB family nutrient-binding outer membrane lipoprotein [Bacteroidia bacterium]|nr:SusD/RagB family nutrient-binding outer membrane lipoprotein [Bacteroidia bacterium]HNS12982.1 SusD/RagB family nutrient-binding outer membrane lipoprotein [Bacteroidia bacterium]
MKKSIKYISLLLSFGAMITLTSCEKDFENINNDPNNPTDVPNSYYLAGAQRGLSDNTFDIWWGCNVGNQLAQYWSSNQYSSESRYQFRTPTTNTYFNLFYAGGNAGGRRTGADLPVGGLLELNRIIDNCKSDPGGSSASGDANNQIAVATMLRVWLLQNMTDTWGDLPYSEALDPEKSRAPKYDRQSDIYSGLISELNTAISLVNTGASGPSGDMIYDGDMVLWKKFGNALKMRIAMRIVDVNASLASTSLSEAIASGTFTSNADNALFQYGEGVDAHPIYYNRFIDKRNDYAASNIMLDILVAQNDPRLPCFYNKATSTDTWVGEVYGLSEANAAATPNSSVSLPSDLMISASLPGIFMDYAQVEFMLAEAAARGIAGVTDAQMHYNNGVTASIEFWTTLNSSPASGADITAYLAQASVDYASPGSGSTYKEKIGKQKWIALYNQGVQGWTEWRRLDFGILQLPADGVLEGTGIPMRMKYAVDEQTINSGNYSAAISNQGPDVLSTKVWWDVN